MQPRNWNNLFVLYDRHTASAADQHYQHLQLESGTLYQRELLPDFHLFSYLFYLVCFTLVFKHITDH
jgi:hypothetical protein